MNWDESYLFSEDDIPAAYAAGAEGVVYDAQEHDAFLGYVKDSGNSPVGSDVAHEYAFADESKGKLVIPFTHVLSQYPTAWPGPAQKRGDCVSHAVSRSLLGVVCTEIISEIPDKKSGKLEEAPEVSAEAESQAVFSSEALYWFRKKNSDGWQSSSAAKVALTKAGAVVRKPYPDVDLDLTMYSAKTAGKWGATPPPAEVVDAMDDHLFRTATSLDSVEEWRDFLGRGFFIASDGGEGFERTRDENGVSHRRGSWSHALCVCGLDDRPETHRLYGCALALFLNSWGKYNSGPRKIRGTDISIPEGSFWAPVDEFRRRATAFSGANGWVRKSLPDLNPGFE